MSFDPSVRNVIVTNKIKSLTFLLSNQINDFLNATEQNLPLRSFLFQPFSSKNTAVEDKSCQDNEREEEGERSDQIKVHSETLLLSLSLSLAASSGLRRLLPSRLGTSF